MVVREISGKGETEYVSDRKWRYLDCGEGPIGSLWTICTGANKYSNARIVDEHADSQAVWSEYGALRVIYALRFDFRGCHSYFQDTVGCLCQDSFTAMRKRTTYFADHPDEEMVVVPVSISLEVTFYWRSQCCVHNWPLLWAVEMKTPTRFSVK